MNEAQFECDVAIVGSGPSGLSAAVQLKKSGVRRVMLLERENECGGIPRHCGHPPFGWPEFRRILNGPQYASRLWRDAVSEGVDIHTETTVTELAPGPLLGITQPSGTGRVKASKVLLATGARETPRSARLVSGTRPLGVMTTGALQSMVYLKSRKPFLRPIVTGTELVSFSALLTCRHAGIHPIAMIEERSRSTAWQACTWLPRLLKIPVLFDSEVISIEGENRVTGVSVRHDAGRISHMPCDGVIFSGKFVSESALASTSHIKIIPPVNCPETDQFGRCSDPDYFAAGNMLHPADSSGRCWHDGIKTANNIVRALRSNLPSPEGSLRLDSIAPVIRYALPQRLVFDPHDKGDVLLSVRFEDEAQGMLKLIADGHLLTSKPVRALPEKQVTMTAPVSIFSAKSPVVTLNFEPSG